MTDGEIWMIIFAKEEGDEICESLKQIKHFKNALNCQPSGGSPVSEWPLEFQLYSVLPASPVGEK